MFLMSFLLFGCLQLFSTLCHLSGEMILMKIKLLYILENVKCFKRSAKKFTGKRSISIRSMKIIFWYLSIFNFIYIYCKDTWQIGYSYYASEGCFKLFWIICLLRSLCITPNLSILFWNSAIQFDAKYIWDQCLRIFYPFTRILLCFDYR